VKAAERRTTVVPRKRPPERSSGAFLGSVALAIITLFSVGLGVFSYLRAEESESRLLAYQKLYQEKSDDRDRLLTTVGRIGAKVGHPGMTDAEALLKAVEDDIHKHGAQDSYPAQITMFLEKIKTERFRAELAEETAAKQRKRAEQAMPNFDAQMKELQTVIDRKNKEILAARDQSHELLGTLEKQVADLQEQLQQANVKMRQFARDREVESGKTDQKIKSLTSAVRGMKEQKNFEENDAESIRKETAAGMVTAVDSASKLVTINVGRSQGVRLGMLFRLFRPDTLGQPKDEVAVLEVLASTSVPALAGSPRTTSGSRSSLETWLSTIFSVAGRGKARSSQSSANSISTTTAKTTATASNGSSKSREAWSISDFTRTAASAARLRRGRPGS